MSTRVDQELYLEAAFDIFSIWLLVCLKRPQAYFKNSFLNDWRIKQNKPAAWKDYDFEQLKQAVYDHTYDVCSSLAAQGTPADMVQVGNEINAGML
jgi:hypothetical protein